MEDNELLKTTALLYFKDALDTQDYEKCPELLAAARKYGATQEEVSNVIALGLQNDRIWNHEASRIKGFRLTTQET